MSLNSLRTRLTAVFLVLLLFLLIVSNLALFFSARKASERRADRLLGAAVLKVRSAAGSPMERLSSLLDDERNITKEYFAVMLVDPYGHILSRSAQYVPSWPHTREDHWRIATVAQGQNTVVIGLYWKRTDESITSQTKTIVVLSLLFLLFAGSGSWFLVGRTLSPIHALSQQARVASIENLSPHLVASSGDTEVVELVRTLNGLLLRLAEAATARGRFYAAASHELRTPLQALSGHLELALKRDRTEQEYRAFIEKARVQALRLMSLVRDLLILNQLEASPYPPAEPVHLRDVCEQMLSDLYPLAEARNLEVEADLQPAPSFLAPPTHVEMLVRNVIENALKYATPGGLVRICTSRQPQQLEVFNSLMWQGEWTPEKLFEPFYRPDPARGTGGNGLGLAICKAITDANGWSIVLEQVEGGVRCTVHFPSSATAYRPCA